MSRLRLVALVLGAVLSAGLCSAAAAPQAPARSEEKAEEFRRGYELFQKKEYVRAAAAMLRHVQGSGAADDNREWALFFLGISLYELGLSHAAADVLSHLVATKPNARIVSYSLEILEEITRTKPFDREGLILDTLCDQEYGFVEQRHLDFVNYYQGLYDWERGYFAWGDERFAKIRRDSHYYAKYLYQKALYAIRGNDLEGATEILKGILLDGTSEAGLKNDARITLARIRYEQGRLREADSAYVDVDTPPVEQARYLLERAWGQYRSGNAEKAMGLLYAFEAPSFWRHFTPEYFILKSLIYKDVCHYPQALGVVQEFHKRYDRALAFLYERGDVFENDDFLLVLLERKEVKRLSDFLGLLRAEREKAARLGDSGLASHLDRLYQLQTEETAKQLRKAVAREFETLADDLLRYEEQAHLIDYEVGLDLYQRAGEHRRKPSAGAPAPEKGVVYAFQGEFWNDELDNYRVVLNDKCDSPAEWDVFFK